MVGGHFLFVELIYYFKDKCISFWKICLLLMMLFINIYLSQEVQPLMLFSTLLLQNQTKKKF